MSASRVNCTMIDSNIVVRMGFSCFLSPSLLKGPGYRALSEGPGCRALSGVSSGRALSGGPGGRALSGVSGGRALPER